MTVASSGKRIDGIRQNSIAGRKSYKSCRRENEAQKFWRRTMIVCVCLRVNDEMVRDAVLKHRVESFDELKEHIRIGTVCGSCRECATMIIEETIAGECDGSTLGS
jgi:bacterioferritin-associated ferredoxin